MKHLLSSTLALAALVMLGACSSDDDIATATGGVTNNNENVPVAFQNYVGRATRGTIETIGTVGQKGFGVFAFYTTDGESVTNKNDVKGYSSESTINANKSFTDNFLSNQKVSASSSVTENSTAWTYSPLKYWPATVPERVSFLAYAPYADGTILYSWNTTDSKPETTGDLTYIKHTVSSTIKDQIDLMWNTTDAINQYLYPSADGSSWEHSNNFNTKLANSTEFGTASGDVQSGVTSNLRQNMKFAHATSRIAIVLTSGVIKSSLNFANATTQGTYSSDAQITVKDVKLVSKYPTNGGNGIKFALGTGEELNKDYGVFYKEAYLNLNNSEAKLTENVSGTDYTTTYGPKWVGQSTTDKLAFDFDASSNSTSKVFVNGTLGDKSYDSNGSGSDATKDKNTFTGKQYWTVTKTSDASTANNVIVGTKTVPESGSPTYSANCIGTDEDGYLFVIPQDFSSSDNLYAYVEYEVVYTDKTNDETGYKLTHNNSTDDDATVTPLKYYAYGKLTKNFVGGHSYVIVINIGGDPTNPDNPDPNPDDPKTFQPITFTVEEVTSWGDEEDPDASL